MSSNNPKTTLFYKNRTPLHVQVRAEQVDFFAGDGMKTLKIQPGPNEIDRQLWEHLKSKEPVEKRLEAGRIVEREPNQELLMSLQGPVNRSVIGMLCAKARDVPDGEMFAAEAATSRDGAVREIEDQIEEMKRSMPTVGG